MATSVNAGARTSTGSLRSEFSSYWSLLVGCFIGATCGVSALYFYTQGIFIKPIAEEFGWSRTALSWGGFITVAANALLAPICGAIIDRVGVRLFATLSMVGFAVALWLLTTLNGALLQYYALMVVLALLSSGTTPLSFSRAINERFNSARGAALGIVGSGIGVSAALAPGFFAKTVAEEGWRQGFADMAVMVLIAAPLVWLLLRSPTERQSVTIAMPRSGGISVAEAMRSSRFWILGGMLLSAALGASATIVHFVPMLTDAGMTAQRAASYALVIGLSVTASRLIVGVLLDRIFAPHIASVVFSAAAVGAFVLAFGGASAAWLGTALMGLALGTESDLTGYMTARYFGMRAYGVLYGTLYSAFLIGMASGPVLAGMAFDNTRSYQLALYGAAAAFAVAAFLATRLGRYPDFSTAS